MTSNASTYTSKLRDQRVLVIGGSSGIGFGIACAVIDHGGSVIISSSSQPRIDAALSRLESLYPSSSTPGRVLGIKCDLGTRSTLESQVAQLFAVATSSGTIKLDHVVHTAGDALAIGKLEDFTLDQIEQADRVRFFSAIVVAQHLRANLNPGPASSYTMTTGGASDRPRKDWAVVMGYLTGLEGLSRALARDLAPMRVNLVGPGPVKTELWDGFHEEAFEKIKSDFENSMCTGTFGRVEDVVEAYLYLMKDKNVTGSMIRTNGGMTLI